MTATVTARPNHYETLRVSPTAGSDEIARAFARECSVFQPHVFGGLAEVCIAYETLRDPIKRRAYDASIGLVREPSPPIFAVGARQALIAKGPAKTAPVDRPAVEQTPPAPQSKPALPLGPALEPQAKPEPPVSLTISPSFNLEEELGTEIRPIDWRRTGAVLGGLVLAASALGGLAGWWSSSAIGETPPPGNVVSLSLPPAKRAAPPETLPIAGTSVESVPEVRNERPQRKVAKANPVDAAPIAAEPAIAEDLPQQSPPDPSGTAAAATEPSATSETSAVAASMPLPNRVIARTIERIGYSCGSVASTEPVAGEAPDVFKVTCSSGQSYRASPVNGRYRFKRLGKR
ncbi:MAG TPA: hypothetical protein VGD23_08100 [Sphingomicrobium sp.]